jgi:hypothetical protein
LTGNGAGDDPCASTSEGLETIEHPFEQPQAGAVAGSL